MKPKETEVWAVKSGFCFLCEILAHTAEKPGFLPSKAEDAFLPDFWFQDYLTLQRDDVYLKHPEGK